MRPCARAHGVADAGRWQKQDDGTARHHRRSLPPPTPTPPTRAQESHTICGVFKSSLSHCAMRWLSKSGERTTRVFLAFRQGVRVLFTAAAVHSWHTGALEQPKSNCRVRASQGTCFQRRPTGRNLTQDQKGASDWVCGLCAAFRDLLPSRSPPPHLLSGPTAINMAIQCDGLVDEWCVQLTYRGVCFESGFSFSVTSLAQVCPCLRGLPLCRRHAQGRVWKQ